MFSQLSRHLSNCRRSLSTTKLGEELQITSLQNEHKGILELGLYRPIAKNSFNKALLRSLQSAILDIQSNKDVRVVIVRSLVPGVFSAGADLKERTKLTEKEVVEFVCELRSTFQDFTNIPPPTIAAIDGPALGGGLELALACDIRVASSSAKMGLVEAKLGIIPGAGGTQRLPRIISPSVAKELIFTASVLNGEEALKLGLVNHVVSSNSTNDAAYLKAVQIAEAILPNGPLAVKLAKRAINKGVDVDIKAGLNVEEQCYAEVVPTKDRIEGLLAFREKRKPIYRGE